MQIIKGDSFISCRLPVRFANIGIGVRPYESQAVGFRQTALRFESSRARHPFVFRRSLFVIR
jgi:hypothetical protein